MKRIAFVTSHAPSLVHFRGYLIQRLIDHGFQVIALAPNHDEASRKKIHAMGGIPMDCSITRTGLNPIRDLLDAIRLAKLLRSLNLDIVFCYFIKPVIYGTVAAWLARVPRRLAMVEGLGFIFDSGPSSKSLKRRLLKLVVTEMYRFALKRADRVFLLNRDDLKDLIELKVLPEKKAFYLGGIGVNLDVWSQTVPNTQRITFVLAARLLREKGIEDYATAACLVKERYPSARFILLGGLDKKSNSISRSEVDEWVSQGVLEWFGHVPVKPFLDASSVFVLPSYYREGIPLSIQEAMAVGRAIITTDSPGCRETVMPNINGFLVPVKNPSLLASSMCKFIECPELITEMGEQSRRMAIKSFDVHEVNGRIIKIILEHEHE